jgi:superfamily II DNA or RNA helicase
MLRKNQLDALNTAKQNDFASGVYFHATGTGKSFIMFKIMESFFQRYPKHNVFWICEHQTILSQLFDSKKLLDLLFDDKTSYRRSTDAFEGLCCLSIYFPLNDYSLMKEYKNIPFNKDDCDKSWYDFLAFINL